MREEYFEGKRINFDVLDFGVPPFNEYRGAGYDDEKNYNGGDLSIWSYMMVKTITYRRLEEQQTAFDNLERLQHDKFNLLKIPKFTVARKGTSPFRGLHVQYIVQHIPGRQVTSAELTSLYDDLVGKQSMFSFTDYSLNKFVKCSLDGHIYPTDLTPYKEMHPDERKEIWDHKMD